MTACTDQGLRHLATQVGRRLSEASQRLVAAESCTGGWISKAITDISGSSQWFTEGFVTYSNDAKHGRLGVPWSVLRKHGAVSEATARAMVVGALRRADADVAVAVTGIAGPDGGVPGKPVGTVWLSWARRRGRLVETTVQLQHFRGDRDAIRRKTVRAALVGLIR
jgi:nicotinamide-nucleotide amidase